MILDIEAHEGSLVSSAMLDPSILDRITDIAPTAFIDPGYGEVWAMLREMRDSGVPVNSASLIRESKARKIDSAMIAKLAAMGASPAHAFYYQQIILESSRLRDLSAACSEAVAEIGKPTADFEAIRGTLEAVVDGLTADRRPGLVSIGQAGTELLEVLDRPRGRPMCWSGIERLDTQVGGFAAGEMIVIAARPGCGKTSLGMQIAKRNGDQDRAVLFFSLEMTRQELVGRVLCGMTDVQSQQLRTGDLPATVRAQLTEAVAELAECNVMIGDRPRMTLSRIRSDCRAQKSARGLSLVVLDYLSLVKPRDFRVSREEQVAEISHGLKDLAKELEVPILVLQQLNREADKQEPKLSNLRESGAIEQDADVVIFPYPASDSDPDEFRLIVAKNRHGETGSTAVRFNRAKTRFEAPENRFQEFDQ